MITTRDNLVSNLPEMQLRQSFAICPLTAVALIHNASFSMAFVSPLRFQVVTPCNRPNGPIHHFWSYAMNMGDKGTKGEVELADDDTKTPSAVASTPTAQTQMLLCKAFQKDGVGPMTS